MLSSLNFKTPSLPWWNYFCHGNLDSYDDSLEDNVAIVRELKEKGYSLYLLSNFHKEAIKTMFERYDFFKLFDGGVISANEHLVKPDQKIYKLLLERYHLQPEESVFIDDMLANIKMAEN